ncbi:Hypothetical predicted protein [Mytilus galloprovincialis]|uniref:Chromo domain-containing protein n=1 Tax=Mytilus galloprovincialis TaxID=29158 RepID=A0A8B6G631_MYTGA|nr:Hypothetical predicted protein [Mytilus galloprovincialis]
MEERTIASDNTEETLDMETSDISPIEKSVKVNEEITIVSVQQELEIREWEEDKTTFVETRATRHILESLPLNNCIVVTGSSGCGKSSNIHQAALHLRDNYGYEIIPVLVGPTDIMNYYNENKKQVFIVDDICGKETPNTQTLQMWRDYSEEMEKIFKADEKYIGSKNKDTVSKVSSPKLLISCRLIIYKESQFQRITLLTKKECNLLSEELCLQEAERMFLLQMYLPYDMIDNVKDVAENVDCFPLLCKLSKHKTSEEILKLFTAPLISIKKNINNIINENKEQLCALSLCILFDGDFNIDWLKVGSASERKYGKLKNIVKEFGIDLSKEKHRNSLESGFLTLKSTYLKQRGTEYRMVHDKICKMAAVICGQHLTKCFIKYAPSVFIQNHFLFESLTEVHVIDDLIILMKHHEEDYFKRLLCDLKEQVIESTFNNHQLIYQTFRDKLISYLRKSHAAKKVLKQLDTQSCIINNDPDKLKCLFKTRYYTTPLIESAASGYIDIVHFLIVNVKCNVNKTDDKSRSPLYKASERGHSAVVRLLLENNADPFQCDDHEVCPFYIACQGGHIDTVKLLLQNNADVSQCNVNGESPLYAACQGGHKDTVELLLQNNAEVSQCDVYGESPLYAACQGGHKDIVELLLKNNAEVSQCDVNGESPLYAACQGGHKDTVELLLHNNAEVSQCDVNGESPLFVACNGGHTDTVDMLLQNNANVSQCNSGGEFPLFVASKEGHTDIVELLLQKNADVSQCNSEGVSALFVASKGGHKDTVELLLQNNAKKTEENLQILEELYQSGMTSKGKSSESFHKEAESKTGLQLQVIKDWIGNRKKKESGRKYEYKKAHYSRGISAYNCFVSEKNKDYQGMKEWAPAWQSLSTEEKLYYKEKASNQTQTTDHPKAAKQLFKKIVSQIVEIGGYNVDVVIMGIDKNNGQQLFFGEKKTAAFFNARPKIMEELYSNHSFGTESTEQKFPFKDLRKKAQDHMNRLYSDAIGQQQVQFPYKKVADRVISIHGFPECLPIKNISHYGEKDLMEILQIKKLVVENQSHHQIDNDDSQVAANGIEPGSEELLYNLLVNPEVEENIYSLASPPVTHILPLQPVTHTVPSLPVTHAFKSPSVTQKLTSPPVTHTLTSPPVTHTQPNKTTVKKSLKKTTAKQTLTLKKTPVTQAFTSPPVKHTLTSPPVTHTLPSPPVTHAFTSPLVTHTLTSPLVTHTLPSPPVTHTQPSPTVTHTLTSPQVTHAFTSPPVTHAFTSPPVTHTLTSPPVTHALTSPQVTHAFTLPPVTHAFTSPPVTHTLTSPPVTHTLPSPLVTHTLPLPPVTHTLPSPPVTQTQLSPPVTHTLTSPLVTHTLTSPPVTCTLTSPLVTHTLTSSPVTHTLTSPLVTHTLTSPPVTHALTSPPVTHTLISPPVTQALPSLPVTHTLISPPVTQALPSLPVTHTLISPPVTQSLPSLPVTHTLISPPVTQALTSPPVTHTLPVTQALTSPSVTHTSKRPRGTAANRTKATKKRKNNKEWGVKGIIATRTVENSRQYLIHWDGFNHDHDSWEPECNLTPSLIGQFFANKI